MCGALDSFLNEISGGEQNRSCYIPLNREEDLHEVIVAYDENLTPVGCAGFRVFDEATVELKRVFVCMDHRRKGIAGKLMDLLEERAKQRGYIFVILETGEPLAAAMRFYRSRGFRIIPSYGPYQNLPDSICMGKDL